MPQLQPPEVLSPIARTMNQAGHACYLVGGAVRNLATGTEPVDFDLATDATPQQVMKLFRRVIPTGIDHGTVTVLIRDQRFEVTTFRVETDYSDSRHPDQVTFTRTIEEDLKRRDFTINGMAVDLSSGELVDPHGGQRDLEAGVVRAIGDARERFEEDGLRLLRAIRFACQLQFSIEPHTWEAIQQARDRVREISAERVRDEIVKIVESRHPSSGFRLMQESGLLALLLPELDRCSDIPHGSDLTPDVLSHSLWACDGAPASDLGLRLAALLHDVGKWDTYRIDSRPGVLFHGHDKASAEHSDAILSRLRFSNAVRKRVVHLVRHHMFNYEPSWSDAAVRRFIARVGETAVADLIALRYADLYGKTGQSAPDRHLQELDTRVQAILNEEQALRIKDLAVDGNVLHRELGIPKAPVMGHVLEYLLERVMEHPELNETARLLELARRYYESGRPPDASDGGGAPDDSDGTGGSPDDRGG